MTGGAFDLLFEVFFARATGGVSDALVVCARASVGPSRTKRVGQDRQTREEGEGPHGSLHVGFEHLWTHPPRRNPCITAPLPTFLRPEDWNRRFSIATFVKSFLSRTLVRRTMFDDADHPAIWALPSGQVHADHTAAADRTEWPVHAKWIVVHGSGAIGSRTIVTDESGSG